MKIAILTTDNRWPFGQCELETPWFGMAPEALLSGFAALPQEVEVHVVSCTRQPVKSPEKLADNIWFNSLHVPKLGWIRTGYLGCIRAVRRRLAVIQPDLVHGHGTEYEAAICAAFSGFPNVITLLGIMKEMARITNARPGSFFWLAAVLESLCLRRTAGVLANSRFTQEQVRSRTRKTWMVPNAVRAAFFENPLTPSLSPWDEKRASGIPERESHRPPVLLNVGTVSTYKRQNELLDVAEQLQAEGLKFHLDFVGGASRESEYAARFLDRVQNRPYASYHRFKSLAEMIESYDGASALVHVSQVESFGLVVAEALSRNLKFIGFSSGGVADIAEGVEGAEGFADGDWASVKAAIRGWLQAGAKRPTSASDTMRQRYHPLEIARRHLEVYREVLGPAGKA